MPKIAFIIVALFSFFLMKGQGVTVTNDLVFAKTIHGDLHMDLYIPDKFVKDVLIVWVHGGAWRSGDKANPPKQLLEYGFPLASINYRLSTEAPFPAQIHDIKAAIRYLRANAKSFGIQSKKIVLWGSSAGGHLAALAGLSNGDPSLEGIVGNFQGFSSSVQGVIDFYGPSNLSTILSQSTPHGLEVRVPALELLYGVTLDNAKVMIPQASPVNYVDMDDPPIFIAHGDQDNQVPINQSIELYGKCKQAELDVTLEFVYGNGHGGYGFESTQMIQKLLLFLIKLGKE